MTDDFRAKSQFEELAELIGAEARDRLVSRFGGRELYVPKRARVDGKLAEAVGLPAAEVLAREYGGVALTVPLGRRSAPEARRRRVATLKDQGHTHSEIAALVGCHIRTVRRDVAHQKAMADL